MFCSVQQLQTFPETILIRFIELVERTIEIPVLSFHITDMIVNQQKFAGEQTTGPLLSECGIKRWDFWVFPLLVLTLLISTISPLLYWIQIFQESSLCLDKRLWKISNKAYTKRKKVWKTLKNMWQRWLMSAPFLQMFSEKEAISKNGGKNIRKCNQLNGN